MISKVYKPQNQPPIIVESSQYSYKEVNDIKKENEELKIKCEARYDINQKLMKKWISGGKTINELNKDILHKDATIRQLEKIIYKLYTGEGELSTGDLYNITRIINKDDENE